LSDPYKTNTLCGQNVKPSGTLEQQRTILPRLHFCSLRTRI